MAFRALGSALTRRMIRPVYRSAMSQQPAISAAIRMELHQPLGRSYAAEAGYLDKDEVSSRVMEVIRKFEKVQPEKVNTNAHFINDLGLDSLDTVELVMAFEDEFAIEIPDADAEKILSCEDAIAYLANNTHAK